ncbi:DUF397 domain-containing protein [Streptomyces sp. NPDC001068]|uniref:DUF397 domain-containing protein n=1 Tax=Streptomyces sp. NPDC001068 TaxID=3364544 RepID=UPI0036B19E84
MKTAAALAWYKSNYSSDEGGNCVEVASRCAAVHIRDSKNPDAAHLTVSPVTWTAFLAGAVGDLDR